MTALETSCRVELIEGAAVICFLEPRINRAGQVESIQKVVAAEIDKGTQRLIFDFENVDFVSSHVIGMLAEVRKQVGAPHGQRPKHVAVFSDRESAESTVSQQGDDAPHIAFCSLPPQIEEVFKICGLIR